MSAPSGYSKRQVDWAGRVWADFASLSKDQRDVCVDSDRESLIEADAVIEWWRREHAYPLTKVNAKLRHYLAPHGRPQVTQRLKKWPTIIYKLQRHPTMRLSAMQDIGGLRAVLQDQDGVDVVAGRLRRNWKSRLVADQDYVRQPKESGYRAIHLVVAQNRRRIEIQLRTPWQDMWAQSAEEDTARLGLGLKFGLGPDDLREYYRLMAEVVAAREQGMLADEGVVARLAKLHPEMRRYFARHRHEP
jgi:ppGpp synthetase/RelA/SpoT-type nucleotidyltranferase